MATRAVVCANVWFVVAGSVRPDDHGTSPLGAALRYWREKRHLSLRQLADQIGAGSRITVSHSQLGKIERGMVSRVERDLVTRCEEVLKTGKQLTNAYNRQTGRMRPRELPPAPALLVGRERHLEELDAALAARASNAPPVMVLDGPAGAGKTALALRWAHTVAHLFPEGQLYADLKAFAPEGQAESPERVLAWFCTALGATEIPDGLEGRMSLFRSMVSGARILIVLDNVASADQVKPLLPGSAGCGVVVTSRRVLSGLTVAHDGRRVSVDPLTETASIKLVTEIIGPHRVDAEPVAVAALARQCGHLPLALRVVAELAFIHPRRPLADLVKDLSAEDERLDRLDADDMIAPRAVFSWTYRDLPTAAARVFRLCGLHRGSHLSVQAVAALAGVTIREARSALRQLAAVHMLDSTAPDASPDVARLHDLLHAYAHELVTEADDPTDREAAARRLGLWYLHTIRAAGQALAPRRATELGMPELPDGVTPLTFPTAEAALSWCDRELTNFAAISRLTADHGPPGAAWKLAVALWDYLLIRKPWDVWRDTHLLGIAAAKADHDDDGERWVTGHWAEALRRQGQFLEAQQLYDLLATHQHGGDQHSEGWAAVGAAHLAINRGQYDNAHSLAQQAESHFIAFDDVEGQASALVIYATVVAARGDHADGLSLLQHALDLVDQIDSLTGRRHVLIAIADVTVAGGDLIAASDALDNAAQEHALADDRRTEADLRQRAGDLRHRLHQRRKATDEWARARDLYTALGDHQSAAALTVILTGAAAQ